MEDEVIDHLVSHGIISDNVGRSVKGLKAFRNVLVHRYGAINDTMAFRLLLRELPDFGIFDSAVRDYLSR